MQLVNINNLFIFLSSIVSLVLGGVLFYKTKNRLELENQKYHTLINTVNFRYLNLKLHDLLPGIILILFVMNSILVSLRFVTGERLSESYQSDVDLLFLVDTSLSMGVEDINGESRINATKTSIIEILEEQYGHRYGLVTYNHAALVESPLTLDKETLKTAVETMRLIDADHALGTSLSIGIKAGVDRLNLENDAFGEGRKKVIVIFSDGEEINSKNENLDVEIEKIRSLGISVYVVGVGTEAGGKVPWFFNTSSNTQEYIRGGETYEYVTSSLEDTVLKDFASKTSGRYYPLDGASKISESISEDVLNLTETGEGIKVYDETYYIFAGINIVLLLLYYLNFGDLKTKLRSREK